MASPSLRNSGFETTSISFLSFKFFNIFSILSPVVTGTVDLVIIILYLLIIFFNFFATLNTDFKSAELEFFFVGVPTQIKIMSELLTAFLRSVVKIILFTSIMDLTIMGKKIKIYYNMKYLQMK